MAKTLNLISLMLALVLVSPWCLKHTVTLSESVTSVDYSPDGTLIAVTEPSKVTILNASNLFTELTYTPSTGTANVAKFSRDGTYLGIGLSTGTVDLLPGGPSFDNSNRQHHP